MTAKPLNQINGPQPLAPMKRCSAVFSLLVRWRHPQRGLVPPDAFIPLAEETGLIVPIGEWVLREACAQARAWREKGLPPVKVAVNLSARQFRQADLIDQVQATLEETRLSPDMLELELTESMMGAARLARACRCDALQGFLFGKPLPPNEFAGLLRDGRTLTQS